MKFIAVLFTIMIFMLSSAKAQFRRCRSQCSELSSRLSASICVIEEDNINCRRVRLCEYRQTNCRLLFLNQPPLRRTSMENCRNIFSLNESGRCALISCTALRCNESSSEIACYRSSSDNRCQLLSECQRQRLNCERRLQNIFLARVDASQCRGMRLGDPSATCSV